MKTDAPAVRQTVHLHNRAHRSFPTQPVTYGVPWAQGELKSAADLVLRDEQGNALPAGFTTLNTWPDGSVQWTLFDTAIDFAPSQNRHLTIEAAKQKTAKPKHPVAVTIDSNNNARITNGLVDLTVSGNAGELITLWKAHNKPVLNADGFDVTFKSENSDYSLKAGPRKISIEHANAMRAVLRLDGKHGKVGGAGDLLDYYLRIEVTAGRADVKITHCFRNRELPTPGIAIRELAANFATAIPAGAKRCFTANTRTRHYLNECMRVDEDPQIVASDTGDLDNYATAHKERSNADCFVRNPEVLHDPMEEKPWWLRDIKFRLQAGGSKCVWPYLALMGEKGGAMVSLSRMTSMHPKGITVQGSTFVIDLYPQWAGDLKITQGAGRSHTMWLAPLAPDATDIDIQSHYLSWEFGGIHTHIPSVSPIEISPDLQQVRKAGVFAIDLLPEYAPKHHFAFERKVLDAWIGVSYGQLGAVDQVAQWPAAGFWHFGDQGGGNNEEMHNLVYFQNYLRSGNFGCFDYALAGTQHMLEVDHCAFSTDHLQTGGQVAHTTAHNNGTAYPSHEWFTEYLFAYVLTGDREYLEGAKRTCEHLLYWINTPEGFQIIAADQREAGQPMINLTWCYEFTRDQRYLDGCWKIVREYLMANTKKFGRMYDGKPIGNPVKVCSYGDYAAWEGMFWLYRITQSEELKTFMLSQLEWRVTPEMCGVHGFHRTTDYNPAAYAFYLTGDRQWLDRVAYPFWHAFRAARWPLGWVHAMYFTKLALDYNLVNDADVLVQ